MLCNICAIYLFLNACFQEQETLAHAVHEMALNNDVGWRKRLRENVGRTIAQFSLLPNGKLLNCCVNWQTTAQKAKLSKWRLAKLTINYRNFKLTWNAKTRVDRVTIELALDYINSK